jgi:hypothetical protein
LDSNLYLIRRRLPVPELRFKEIIIGKFSKTRVIIAYLEGIAEKENINTVTQRIKDIESEVHTAAGFVQLFFICFCQARTKRNILSE